MNGRRRWRMHTILSVDITLSLNVSSVLHVVVVSMVSNNADGKALQSLGLSSGANELAIGVPVGVTLSLNVGHVLELESVGDVVDLEALQTSGLSSGSNELVTSNITLTLNVSCNSDVVTHGYNTKCETKNLKC